MDALPDGMIVAGVVGLASNDMSRPNIAASVSWNHLASVKGSEDEIETNEYWHSKSLVTASFDATCGQLFQRTRRTKGCRPLKLGRVILRAPGQLRPLPIPSVKLVFTLPTRWLCVIVNTALGPFQTF